ncbi:FliH/SctL family protein [Roseivivax sp. CAU 1761]
MRLADLLEEFGPDLAAGPAAAGPGAAAVAESEVEAREGRAFENGYRAGWDDAVKAQGEESERMGRDFAQNLRDLSFTYHEAYSHVLRAMTPLLTEIVDKLVPASLGEGLAAHLVAELEARAGECGGFAVEIAVAPEQLAQVEPHLAQEFGFPVSLRSDPTLNEGQADLRLAEGEIRLDLTEIADGLRRAVTAFRHQTEGDRAHG